MLLTREQIVGERLERIVQTYELLDGYLDFAYSYFVLESGIAFGLPSSPESAFESQPVPPSAQPIAHPLLDDALKSPIKEVYRRVNGATWLSDYAWLQTESGLWIGQCVCLPHGLDGVGVFIQREFEELDEIVPFWPI